MTCVLSCFKILLVAATDENSSAEFIQDFNSKEEKNVKKILIWNKYHKSGYKGWQVIFQKITDKNCPEYR